MHGKCASIQPAQRVERCRPLIHVGGEQPARESPVWGQPGHMAKPCLRKLKCFKCFESRNTMKNSHFYLEKLPSETFRDPVFWITLTFQGRMFSFVDTIEMKWSVKENLWFLILKIPESLRSLSGRQNQVHYSGYLMQNSRCGYYSHTKMLYWRYTCCLYIADYISNVYVWMHWGVVPNCASWALIW